jgi:hypothetical protein
MHKSFFFLSKNTSHTAPSRRKRVRFLGTEIAIMLSLSLRIHEFITSQMVDPWCNSHHRDKEYEQQRAIESTNCTIHNLGNFTQQKQCFICIPKLVHIAIITVNVDLHTNMISCSDLKSCFFILI